MNALLIILGLWIIAGFIVMKTSSSFSIFSQGPNWLETVLIIPFALLCYVLEKFHRFWK